jgi:hypothetical protein
MGEERDAPWHEDLRDEFGDAPVDRFLARAGGMRLYVPRRKLTGSPLVALAGRDIASWLSDRYAGDTIDVPSNRALASVGLREALAREPDAPINLIANRFGVTARRVLQVKAEIAREEEPPMLRLMRNPSS